MLCIVFAGAALGGGNRSILLCCLLLILVLLSLPLARGLFDLGTCTAFAFAFALGVAFPRAFAFALPFGLPGLPLALAFALAFGLPRPEGLPCSSEASAASSSGTERNWSKRDTGS